MKELALEQAASYLEAAIIENTINCGFAVINIGISDAGANLY
jgi:hypothetical protein